MANGKKKKKPDHTRPIAQDKTRVARPRKSSKKQVEANIKTIKGLTKRAKQEYERGVRIENTLKGKRATGGRFITDITDPEERKAIAKKMDKGRKPKK